MFIYNIGEEVLREISTFVDDAKIASRVNILNNIRSMKRNLDTLVAWANKWDMNCNVNKCGVMHGKEI